MSLLSTIGDISMTHWPNWPGMCDNSCSNTYLHSFSKSHVITEKTTTVVMVMIVQELNSLLLVVTKVLVYYCWDLKGKINTHHTARFHPKNKTVWCYPEIKKKLYDVIVGVFKAHKKLALYTHLMWVYVGSNDWSQYCLLCLRMIPL